MKTACIEKAATFAFRIQCIQTNDKSDEKPSPSPKNLSWQTPSPVNNFGWLDGSLIGAAALSTATSLVCRHTDVLSAFEWPMRRIDISAKGVSRHYLQNDHTGWSGNMILQPLSKDETILVVAVINTVSFYTFAAALHSRIGWRGSRSSRAILLAVVVAGMGLSIKGYGSALTVDVLPVMLILLWICEVLTGK